MTQLHALEDVTEALRGRLVIIGNFDGIHLGHQALINQAQSLAKEQGLDVLLLTFEPHPRKLFRPEDPPFRITPAPLKMARLKACGVADVLTLPFDWEFASQSATDFIRNLLQEGLDAVHVVVGEDFRFGQLRRGTPEMIDAAGISVTVVAPTGMTTGGKKISSSDVRAHLRRGEVSAANELLGWDWEISGIVQEGDKRGRELGYPTANMTLGDSLHPAYGIYACYVQIEQEEVWYPSAANIGIRPMFQVDEGLVEAHVLGGFDRDIYGKALRVRPIERLRGEAKFDSLEALIAQMEKDCLKAKEILSYAD